MELASGFQVGRRPEAQPLCPFLTRCWGQWGMDAAWQEVLRGPQGPIMGLGLAGAALQMLWADYVVSGHCTG